MNTPLEFLKNKSFIGDLSLQDADIISEYASQSKHILEFGSGGSTQLLAQWSATKIISVETNPHWIQTTKNNLMNIPFATTVEFLDYTTQFNLQFDLIFVDGVEHLRREFAIETWKYLNAGGTMLFHDTRRFLDFQNAAWVAQLYHNEISRIYVNATASDGVSSNITVIHKKPYEDYINWNYSENKPLWAYGISDGLDHPMWSYK